MKLFSQLVQAINEFTPDEPMILESQMEKSLRKHLQKRGFLTERQVTKKADRYDLVCRNYNETVCIELKLRTDVSNLKQYDKYLPKFKDGLIVVCWQASRTVKDVFFEVTEQSPIPVTLIEISRKYALA